jgi:large subunit ribosomal protein L3
MITGLLGKKVGMTQVFKADTGEAIPVTVIEAGPCTVLQVKTSEKDGYKAVQLGFDEKKPKQVNKPDMGRFKKVNITPLNFVREIKTSNTDGIKVTDKVGVDIFNIGEYVDISGRSIGKGFQGGVKRWNWKGGPGSHGSMFHRAPGSIATNARLTRVIKGHHLPGHMGYDNVTVQNLEVVEVDKENNLLLVRGAVPGPDGNYLIINRSFKKKMKEPRPVVVTKKKEDPLKKSKKAMKEKLKK